MRFQVIRRCRRTEEEQRYIYAALGVFARLPLERREQVRSLVGELAATPLEGRALFELLTRGETPPVTAARTGVPAYRLYELRRAFYDRFPLG